MSRPLIISDCDEVILHMVAPFKEWLESTQGVDFELEGANFSEALRWKRTGELLVAADIWRKLGDFFKTEMSRQMPINGSIDALNELNEYADVVVLTNLVDENRLKRAEQLSAHGLTAPVYTNQGPKGPAVSKLIAEFSPSRAIFIDDLAQHHLSTFETVPQTVRLHMCGEPLIAGAIDCAHKAGHADARIDQWQEALPWIIENLEAAS